LFNQARGFVEIETNGGITGIGEGGSKDMIEQCAQMMIGEDPFRIEYIGKISIGACFIVRAEKNYMRLVL
jgi:L-alanine-DL-glutamate epimerase-like enolase superfamily enzyme